MADSSLTILSRRLLRWCSCWYGQAVVTRPDAGSIPATAASTMLHYSEFPSSVLVVISEVSNLLNHTVNYGWKGKPTGDGSRLESGRA